MKSSIVMLFALFTFINTYSQSEITDLDNDTKVQTEANSDEDIIRFTVNGTEYFRMDGSTIEVLNSGGSVYIGENSGKNVSVGDARNVGIGRRALEDLTTGDQNTAVGEDAMPNMLTGEQNVAIGESAMLANSSGTRNTIVGQSAMRSSQSGSFNVGIGEEALYSSMGDNNTAVGREAGEKTGTGGVFLGHRAGQNETGDNKLYIDNTNTPSPLIYGEFDNDLIIINGTCDITSDKRLKHDINRINNALSKITELNGYSYKRNNIKNADKTEIGVIAQEVKNVIPEIVGNNREGMLTVNYSALIPVLIEAIKELQLEINMLKGID